MYSCTSKVLWIVSDSNISIISDAQSWVRAGRAFSRRVGATFLLNSRHSNNRSSSSSNSSSFSKLPRGKPSNR